MEVIELLSVIMVIILILGVGFLIYRLSITSNKPIDNNVSHSHKSHRHVIIPNNDVWDNKHVRRDFDNYRFDYRQSGWNRDDIDEWNRTRRRRLTRQSCDRARDVLRRRINNPESSEFDEDEDDVFGRCSNASPECREYAECTDDNSIKSGCSVKTGRGRVFGCPASCCYPRL